MIYFTYIFLGLFLERSMTQPKLFSFNFTEYTRMFLFCYFLSSYNEKCRCSFV